MANKFNYIKGGADRYFLDLADLLVANGHKVAKFCMQHNENYPDKFEKYFVSYLNFNKFEFKNIWKYIARILYSFESASQFEKIINDFQPEIIHIHNIYHQISPSILTVAKKYKIPVVMHLHDYKLLCPNYKMYNSQGICEKCRGEKYYNCAKYKCVKNSRMKSILAMLEMYLHHKILKIYEQNVDLFIAPSEFLKNKAIEWGINKQKIIVQPYFIDTNKFKSSENNDSNLLFVGRLVKEKGILTLLRAMSKLNKDIKLKIVGAGPEYQRIKKEIQLMKLEKQVTLVGPKQGRELRKLIGDSMCLIVPSEWYEVTGIVNLEAQSMSKPIISSNIGGISEAMIDGKTGYLFKTGSAEDLVINIGKIVDNQELRQRFGHAGRQFVMENFSRQKHWQDINKIYESLVK